jgi:hypothetical protein
MATIGMGGNQNPVGNSIIDYIGSIGPKSLAYAPPKGYFRNFTYDKDGNIFGETPEGMKQQLNGLSIDAKSLPTPVKQYTQNNNSAFGGMMGLGGQEYFTPDYTQGGGVSKLSFDNAGNLYAMAGGKKVAISGYQSDPNSISKNSGSLPEDNNAYLKYDGNGLFVEVQTDYKGKPLTSAYARQALQAEKTPEGVRLSRKGGSQTSTLGGAPTSTAAGSQLADEINLRNRKGTLIT